MLSHTDILSAAGQSSMLIEGQKYNIDLSIKENESPALVHDQLYISTKFSI
jgi:hypothetical protein